jgi:uncharacterized protein (DUF2141 family)
MIRRQLATIAAGLLIMWTLVGAQQQARDAAVVPAGTATVSGRVTIAGAAKQPARRTRVTLTNLSRGTPGQTTTTDDSGAFVFHGVPAGRFEVQAVKTGYLRASYGAARPERAGTPIVVRDGEAVAGIGITIARGGVITGVVRDGRGRPVPGVSVRVLRFGFNALSGERSLGAVSGGSGTVTDDRGAYRAYGLPPGGYVVLALPTSSARSGGPGEDARVLTSAELEQALRAARATGAGAAASQPPAPPAAPSRVSYAPVFHPGVTNIMSASTITLGLSEERTGADITLQYLPAATISGRISSATGTLPQPLRVTLVPAGAPAELLAGAGLRGTFATARPDGTYAFPGVAPGTYTVKALTGVASGGRGLATPSSMPAMWASADVVMSGQDLDVPLTLQPGITITGRVVFEGAQPSPEDLQSLTFRLVPSGSGGQILSSSGGRVDRDGRFTLADITPDAYTFVTQWTAAGGSGRWVMKSSVANGRDAYDAPLRVDGSVPIDWTVTYSDKPTTLSGQLSDATGRPATVYYILAFPTDRQYWTPGSRRVRMMRPATDGTFTTDGLPPGEYFVAALTDLEAGEWNDGAFLEQLVSSSAKVVLREGETTRQDLRIGGE